jgi:succinate dehydrogenase/fumarate reductase flavoprotein subunit
VQQLIHREGRVAGVIAEADGRRVEFIARRGVVLAAGGFPQDKRRRSQFFHHDGDGNGHASPAPLGNTGDGITLAESVGGGMATDMPNAAAWIPVSRVPYRDGSVGVFPHLIDRYKPGIIAVTRNGRRFVNEADSYHDFGKALLKTLPDGKAEAFLIADHRAIRRYGLGAAKPFPLPLLPYLRSGYLLRGNTPAELASAAGIDAAELEKTIARFNGPASRGEDPEFGKGSTAYNRYLGDAQHQPNACVAPLDTPPYYAVKVVIGDLGTFAGIRTDDHARVLDAASTPIPGLYAAGNDMASIMGGNYPGAGITLGPAMTFGYIAGLTIAGSN